MSKDASTDVLQLECDSRTLELMLRSGVLHAEDVHCLNSRSHRRMQQLIKQLLTGRRDSAC